MRHRGVFALRLTGELRLVGQDVNVLPIGIGSQNEIADVSGGGQSPTVVVCKRGPLDDLVFADVVDTALDAGELGSSLAPSERA